jgi:hypothetical protein
MLRIVLSVFTLILLASRNDARADFVYTTDPTAFASNDVAPWVVTPFASGGGPYSTTNGFGSFRFGFAAVSVPFDQTLVVTPAGALFVGVTSSPISGNPRFPGGTAYYQVDTRLDLGPNAVFGFGFRTLRVSPETQLRVFDVLGNSREFTVPTSPGSGSNFVGITSDVPISRFSFSERVVDTTAVLHVGPVSLNIAVPAPPSFALVLMCVVFGRVLRRS